MVYDKASSGIILKLKHGDVMHLAPALGEWMWSRSVDVLKDVDCLIPVPLHWFRLFMRRYNHATILAKGISEKSSLPIMPYLLRRQRFTKSQAYLNRKQRQHNVKKAFYVPLKQMSFLRGKKIALIDDVFTTGATINECTRVLLKAGCAEVRVITLARVVVQGD
jgi:ComF family protein